MKKHLLSFALLLFFFAQTKAQFIIAGQHGAKDYYAAPDTYILYGNYQMDINGDGIIDFQLTLSFSNGGGGTELENYAEILAMNHNQVAVQTLIDTCGTYQPYHMTFPFNINDSIYNTGLWKNNATLADHEMFYPSDCSINSSYSAEWYLGVRIFLAKDTLYGWIGVSGANTDGIYSDTYEIVSYACNLGVTGINEYQNNYSVKLSPNPATNQLTIHLSSFAKDEGVNLFITNVLGQTLYQSAITNPQSEIDVSSLPAGLYLAKVVTDKGAWTGKFIKQ